MVAFVDRDMDASHGDRSGSVLGHTGVVDECGAYAVLDLCTVEGPAQCGVKGAVRVGDAWSLLATASGSGASGASSGSSSSSGVGGNDGGGSADWVAQHKFVLNAPNLRALRSSKAGASRRVARQNGARQAGGRLTAESHTPQDVLASLPTQACSRPTADTSPSHALD